MTQLSVSLQPMPSHGSYTNLSCKWPSCVFSYFFVPRSLVRSYTVIEGALLFGQHDRLQEVIRKETASKSALRRRKLFFVGTGDRKNDPRNETDEVSTGKRIFNTDRSIRH